MSTHSDGPSPTSASGPDEVIDVEGLPDEPEGGSVSDVDEVMGTEHLPDEPPPVAPSEPEVVVAEPTAVSASETNEVVDTDDVADELPPVWESEPDYRVDEEPPAMAVSEPDVVGADDPPPMFFSEPDVVVPDEAPPVAVDEADEMVDTEGFSEGTPRVAGHEPGILLTERPADEPLATSESHADEIIRTEGLTKIYQSDDGEDLMALDHLDLSVCKGEIFGLLGPNGAGKTTTVGMLTTRVIPTSGHVIVGGVDVVAEPARAKHGIGVVHQANTLDRSLTVSENLYFHARYFGMNAKAANFATEEALERFRLGARRKAEVRTLSGGMARRLMVARAILHHPAVLFLDEPTAGLDPQSRLALWDIVSELHDDGQTIMLTTHYMEEADRFCSRVAIIDHGRILALDTPANLKQSADLRHDSAGAAKAQLARLRAIARVAETAQLDDMTERTEDGAVLLDPVVAPDTAEELFEGVTLESVFIELTGRDLRE